MRLGVQAALVDGALVEGDVAIADGRIAGLGLKPAAASGLAVPGFVDLQVNGFAGVDFLTADADGYEQAGQAMAATGVTAYLPTFISSPPDAYREALAAVAVLPSASAGPRVLGVHLEGPFLSPRWPGAHNPTNMLEPDLALADNLCDAGPVAMMTLAPELPGALELIEHAGARGVVVSCGHSDADAGVAHAAFDRGARAITHVHNAHRRWQPRDPGLGGVAVVRPDVTVPAIVDGVHLAPETVKATFLAARERFCLVTDAVQAAGLGDGSYRLGDRTIHVADGAARLADGTLAGSVGTMDQAVRNLVELGATVAEAVGAATRAPATLLGNPDLGRLVEGGVADVVVLDEELRVVRTLVGGAEAFAQTPRANGGC
jgi:N-acetylglucosamine-6-phosphate deacetylase